jgi:hypothetical protein
MAEYDSSERWYDLPEITLDEKASNGGENARNSLEILFANGKQISPIVAVAHATSLRRLSETLVFEGSKKFNFPPHVHRKPSDYPFDPGNPKDRDEAAAELLRLADWPEKGLLGPQPDLPANLVDFVRDVHGNPPKPIAPWQSNVLRLLPKRLQQGVIAFAAKRGRK